MTGYGTLEPVDVATQRTAIATNAASRLAQTKQSAGNPGRFNHYSYCYDENTLLGDDAILRRIIYSSRASDPLSVEEAQTLLKDARNGNARRNVSGVLIYKDEIFLQVLEGEHDVLERLMRNIIADSRHCDVEVIRDSPIDKRDFDAWRMAYLSPSESELARWVGLEGATSVNEMLAHIRRSGAVMPGLLLSLVSALDSRSRDRAR